MSQDTAFPLDGRCTCGAVRYRLTATPIVVHCCHCSWCQRETGTAFALNAVVEADNVTLLAGSPETVLTPSLSGKGQKIVRCPACRVAVWSHYPQAGDRISFVRVGTLETPDRVPPDIHIYTSTRQPWVVLGGDVPAVPEFYNPKEYWPAESLTRFRAARQ
jgi:hypothetical protein